MYLCLNHNPYIGENTNLPMTPVLCIINTLGGVYGLIKSKTYLPILLFVLISVIYTKENLCLQPSQSTNLKADS